MKIEVSNLLPNPFRHLDRYPISDEKVEALKRSIKDTTFWDNLLVRKSPEKSGKYEIAYGHHRLIALKKARVDEIDVPVRALTDTLMAQIMAHENMEEWGHSTEIEQETIRAIIEGYADGRIDLPPVTKGTTRGNIRLAPSFQTCGDGETSARAEVSYTAATLCEFLGWKPYKVEATLGALALIEDGLATEEQFKKLSSRQAETVVTETRFAEKETGDRSKAKAVGKRIAKGLNRATRGRTSNGTERDVQDVTIHNARSETKKMLGLDKVARKDRPKGDITEFAQKMVFVVADAFPTEKQKEKLDALVQYREDISKSERRSLIKALRDLATRANRYADRLEAGL